MLSRPLFWVAVVAAYPVAQLAYVALWERATRVAPRLRHYSYWSYAAFSLGYGASFYATTPVEIPWGFRLAYLALVPAGAALYYADTWAVERWVGKSLRTDVSHPLSMLPILLVPVPEEILFRAGLAPLLDAYGSVAFVVASAALFGLIHFTFGARDVAVKVGNGAVFAVLFVLTGSVTASALAHVGYNLASFHVFSDYSRDVAVLP